MDSRRRGRHLVATKRGRGIDPWTPHRPSGRATVLGYRAGDRTRRRKPLSARLPDTATPHTSAAEPAACDTRTCADGAASHFVTEQERQRLLLSEMLVRALQKNLITEQVFALRAQELDKPGAIQERLERLEQASKARPGILAG